MDAWSSCMLVPLVPSLAHSARIRAWSWSETEFWSPNGKAFDVACRDKRSEVSKSCFRNYSYEFFFSNYRPDIGLITWTLRPEPETLKFGSIRCVTWNALFRSSSKGEGAKRWKLHTDTPILLDRAWCRKSLDLARFMKMLCKTQSFERIRN